MRSERVDEALLIQYLLGELPDAEQNRVEDRAFADPEYLGVIEAAETDLIDDYVMGRLNDERRVQFERRFLNSPQRRRKVEFARSLALVPRPAAAPAVARASRQPFWQAIISSLGPRPAWRYASAVVAILVIAGAAWLAWENGRMRSRLAAMEAQARDVEHREQALRAQLAQEQTRSQELSQQPNRPSAAATASPAIASLLFLPGQSRAAADRPALVLQPTSQLARLEIQIEPRDDYPRYRIELHARQGETILTRSNLTQSKSGGASLVSFDVPASALPSGEYELALKGVAGGNAQEIGYYYFTVRR